jgi:hypothetical protein
MHPMHTYSMGCVETVWRSYPVALTNFVTADTIVLIRLIMKALRQPIRHRPPDQCISAKRANRKSRNTATRLELRSSSG